MTIYTAKSVVLDQSLDVGVPTPDLFSFPETSVDSDSLVDGDILIQAQAISADPYLRQSIKSTGNNKPGSPLSGFIAGKVVQSKNPDWVVGDFIGASLPFSTYQIVAGATLSQVPKWKLTGYLDDSNISLGIGLLGMPGCTAWGGVIEVLRPKEGETIFISAAAGAVGSLVGMLAKNLYNCKVIGSCGGTQKCELIKSKYGFDHAIDYKTLSTKEELVAKLKEVAPDGIDMYFENVGGFHFDAALEVLRDGGRVAICGFISEYNHMQGLKLEFDAVRLLYKRQRIEGVLCFPWLYQGKFVADMSKFLKEGKIVSQETYFDGIEQWPNAFIALFTGANIGKVVVRV